MHKYSYTPTTRTKAASNRIGLYLVCVIAAILAYATPHAIAWWMEFTANFGAKISGGSLG